ncbi:ubiquitin-conjugating_enzyme_E2_-_putative [Leishmania major strain Friedlin]|nr:ubiquitin-conjugating_enzyme_E2_-_putative [Leishmania major strain Friedlin]
MEGRTSARCALVCMTSAALALALLIPAACGFVGAAAAAPMTVTTTPSLPLLDVPFHADVAGIGKGHSLFVSSQSDCSAASKVTSVCTLGSAVDGVSFANGTCVFHVTSEALGVDLTRPRPTVPALYWCSSARPGASVGALQMNVVSTVPLFFYRAEYNELTFSDATPLGSVIRWSSNPDCGSPLPNHANAVLGSSRVVPLKYSGDTVYVCATIPTVSGAMTALEHRATVIGTYLYRISPTSGVRHRTISMTTTITESIAMISVSHDPYCRTLEQPGKFYASLTSFDFVWSVAAGVYYLCVITNKDVGLPSSNSFTVEEYDVQPHTMYVARETPLTYGLSAAGRDAELETALATTTDCIGGSLVVPWGASMSWAVAKVGTYYACVRDRGAASTAGYTSAITVTDVPTLTFSPSPAVLGVPVSATVSHALSRKNVFRVRVSKGGTCDSEGATGATPRGSATATVRMPLGMPASVTYCVSNPLGDGEDGADTPVGGAVYYALGALRTRAYRVGHGALLTNMRMTMRLDSEVLLPRGTSVVLAPSARVSGTCPGAMAAADAAGADESMAFDVSGASAILSPVVFASPGAWLVCVRDGAGGDAGYTQAAQLQVYSDAAALSTDTVLNGVRTEVVVSRLPPEAPVTVTSSSTCGLSMESVGAGTTNSDGVVTLNVQSASAGPLLVCAGYPTASESSATDVGIEYAPAGTVRSANARVYPSIAYVSETTTLSFAGIGGMSLTGYFAFFLPHATSCSEPDATVLGSGLKGPDATSTVSYGTVSGSALERGTVYRVCVGRSIDDGYCDAGVVAAMEVPSVSTDPPVPVRGLPVRLQLPPSFTSTAAVTFYVVVGDTARCSGDLSETRVYGSGSVDRTSGATAAFVAPARASGVDAVRVCVGSNESLVSDSLGYTHGATLRLEQFHTSMVYLQRGVPNVLSGAPMAATGSLYVVACDGKECAADNADGVCRAKMSQGATSSATAALNAPLGRYFLCQRVTVGTVVSVVGSNTTVEVVEPFKMHLSVDPSAIRAYVPFAVTMSGGPGGAGAKYTVVAQPASTPCGETAAESQRFVTGRDTTDITITDIVPVQNIRFCVQPSPADSFEVLTGTLQHYMTPAAVIGDRATTLTSGGVRRGATAVLSRTADCLGVVAGGGAAPIVDARVTFTVTSCGANGALASLYYCEAASGGAYASRGAVGLLRASGCSGGADASIAEVDAAPGAAIGSFGIDTAYLARPRLSASPDCDVLLDAAVASVGYAPGADERAAFHVCAVLAGDASVTFTTARPTLRVANWAVSPTAAVSRYNATLGAAAATAVRVNYATPSSETFLSTASDCSVRTASAAGLSGASRSATYSTTGVRGLVYVCTVAPLSGKTLAVAQFLSVTPPAVLRVSPAVVRGGEYSATLVVDGAPPLYSMVPGADSGYTHSGYYTSASREVYLSGDACSGVLAGTSAATVSSSGSVSLATAGVAAGVSSVWLCAVTAAGPAVVLAGVAVAPGRVHPTTMVSGALGAPVFIPSLKGTAVQLSASASGCGSVAGMPSFTTDAEGYGAVDLVGGDGGALAPGTYTLCYGGAPRGGGGGAAALESVELVRASYFDVRGTTFVVGVAGRMPLLQDLTAEALVPGFSTARDCTSVSSEHGEWAAVTSTSVSVTATSVYTAGLYLCARAPVNGTLVALPGQWSEARSVQFVASAMQLPSAGWDACTTYTLGQCYPPGASASGATSVVAVVHGDCCSESSRSAVVGEASMASGTCELTLDYDKVSAYPAGSTYHVCVWDSADDSVCTTVSEARVSTNCTRGGRGLSRGAVAGVAVACIVCGAVVGLAVFAVWYWCLSRASRGGAEAGEDSKKTSGTDDDVLASRSWLSSSTEYGDTTVSTPGGCAFPEEGHELGDELQRSGDSGPVFGDHPVMRSMSRRRESGLEMSDKLSLKSVSEVPLAPLTVKRVSQLRRGSGSCRSSMKQQIETWRRALQPISALEAQPAVLPTASPQEDPSIPHIYRVLPPAAEPKAPPKPLQRAPLAAAAESSLLCPPTSKPWPQSASQAPLQQMPQHTRPADVQSWQPLSPERQTSASTRSRNPLFSVFSLDLSLEKSVPWILSEGGSSSEEAVVPHAQCSPRGTAPPFEATGPTARHLRTVREQDRFLRRNYEEDMRQWLQSTMMAPEVQAYLAQLAANARSSSPQPPPPVPPQGPANREKTPPAPRTQKPVPFEKARAMPAPQSTAPGVARTNAAGAAPPRPAQPPPWPLPEERHPSPGRGFNSVQFPAAARSDTVSLDVSSDTNGQLRLPQCTLATAAADAARLTRKPSMPRLPQPPSQSSEYPVMYSDYGPTGIIGPAVMAGWPRPLSAEGQR